MSTKKTIPTKHATNETFDALVLAPTGELVIVYFWGNDCPNCEIFASQLPSLLEELGDVRATLVKVYAYTETELARRFGVYGIPAFYLFRDGKKLGRMSEFRGRAFFLDVLRESLPVDPQAELRAAIAEASETVGLDTWYRSSVEPLMGIEPSRYPRCCGSGCEPCSETLIEVAVRAQRILDAKRAPKP